jgi:murein DD-endopeptidase MepM/ murein hydrolase activator NlpD
VKQTTTIPILIACVIILISQGAWRPAGNAHTDGGGRDTVKAVVSYGNEFLFRTAEEVNDVYFQNILDSLYLLDSPPADLIREIRVYQAIQKKDYVQIATVIDSLFELDTVPFALINEINLYIAKMPEDFNVPDDYLFVPHDTSPYPAHGFYNVWNTRNTHPYPSTLSANDTLLMLLLAESKQNCVYSHPLEKEEIKVTSGFGYREGRRHNGIDLDLDVWDPVHAAFSGMVRYARFHEGYGRLVIVRHYNGLETFYAHLHRLKVEPGDVIEAGDVIGLGGSSGNSTGSHLHFEIRFKGVPINPAHLISFKDRTLRGDTLVMKKVHHSYAVYPKGTTFHTVARGDSPYKIAKRYGIMLSTLFELNGFTKRTHLKVGQKIRIQSRVKI